MAGLRESYSERKGVRSSGSILGTDDFFIPGIKHIWKRSRRLTRAFDS